MNAAPSANASSTSATAPSAANELSGATGPSEIASAGGSVAPSASRTLAFPLVKSPSSGRQMAVGASRLQPPVGVSGGRGRSLRLSTRSPSVACSVRAAPTVQLATSSFTPAALSDAAATTLTPLNANTRTTLIRNSDTPMATATTHIATQSRTTLHSTASKLSVRCTLSTTSSSDSQAATIILYVQMFRTSMCIRSCK